MTRSSFAVKFLAVAFIVLGNVACGDNKPPPATPETPSDDGGGGGGEGGTSAGDVGDGGATSGGDTTAASSSGGTSAPAALALPTAAAKLKFKSKKDFDVELKSDGSVTSGGKPAAKISGMELQTPDGKTQLKVDSDGNITTGEGAPYAKFEGDELAAQNNAKYSVGEDGALHSTSEKGTKASMGKAEGVGSAKRAALLAVAFVMWGTKAPAAPAAKGGKAEGGKGGKKPGKK